MPKKDWQQAQSDTEDISVHLKPILGVRPGLYLSVLYGLIVILIVFFLLFYPGVRNRGSYRSITTFPDHATVKVDGVYAGSTPCTIFLKAGERVVEISKPFFAQQSLQESITGRVFGTLLAPEKKNVTRALIPSDVTGLLKWALADFQKNPGIPKIISDAPLAAIGADSEQQMYDFIDKCMFFVSNEPQLKELLLGASRISSRGGMLTPNTFIKLVEHSIQLKQKYDNIPSWLLLILSRPNGNKLAAGAWIQQYLSTYRETISKYYQPATFAPSTGGGGSVTVHGIPFRAIPAGVLVMGKDDNLDSFGRSVNLLLAHPVTIDSFYLGSTEVTNSQYQSFVAESPEWAPNNLPALVGKGLAGEGYLSDWPDGRIQAGHEDLPVTRVSWHAAVAFGDWLTGKAQATMPGYLVRLPTEAEWEWAARGGLRGMPYPLGGTPGAAVFFHKGISGPARAGASEPNGYGLRDMLGNVWEWCADPFSLAALLLSSLDPRTNASLVRSLPDSVDHAVRGGGWANQPGTDKVFTRGYQPAEWGTPYLGFRVALARR